MRYVLKASASGIYTKKALSFRCTLMILHLSRMRRNVNQKIYNARKNVSATASGEVDTEHRPSELHASCRLQPRAAVTRRLRFQTALSSRETYRFTRHVVGWSRANARRQRARHLLASRETTSLGEVCVIRRDVSRSFNGDRALCHFLVQARRNRLNVDLFKRS